MSGWRARAAIIGAAFAAGVLPFSSRLVEQQYSDRVYAAAQRVLTTASNAVPFALFDLLVAAVAAAWIALAWRDARRAGGVRAVGRILVRSLVWGAAVYIVFLALWGLNYRRIALRDKLPYDASAVTADAVAGAARAAVARLNALHDAAHDAAHVAGRVDEALAAAFARARRDARLTAATVPARPKSTIFDWYFRRSGTAGMTDPFFLETLVSSAVLPFERPFVIAHEWSHLAGIGDEGEANFVGWLTCMRGGPSAQYSGALFLYEELAAVVPPRERAALAAALADGPREDLRAVRARDQREIDVRVAEAGWRIYDRYLRANHVEAGTASYAEVVQLVLGVRLP